jgi:deoxyadenosine/deoxycytidine kinase
MVKIISIEGNIGAGKTTILEKLQRLFKNNRNILFLREPLHIWESIQDSNGESILAKFYANPTAYAFTFQVMAFVTRVSMLRKAIKENPNCQMIICERSLEADRNVFAKMLYDDNMIEDINYKVYLQFYEEYKEDFKLDGIVYIDSDADVCYNRIKKRSRTGEEGVPLEYLKNCQEYHNDWLSGINHKLRINTNDDVTYDMSDPLDKGMVWLKMIKDYIYGFIEENNTTYSSLSCL